MEVEGPINQLVHGSRSFVSNIPPDSRSKQVMQAQQGLDATGSSSVSSERYVSTERLARQGDVISNENYQTPRKLERSINTVGDTTLSNTESQQQSQEGDDKQDDVSIEEEHDQLWILPCFRIGRSGHKAKHIGVGEQTYDSELFGDFRNLYFTERSWLRRFVELKEVSKLDFVQVSLRMVPRATTLTDCAQFNLTDVDDASIIKYDVWPPQEVSTPVLPVQDHKQEWYYKPCPVKQIPLVGTDHLLHIWRNPHHADHRAYQEWLESKGFLRRFLEWLRGWPVRIRQRFVGVPMPRSNGQAENTGLGHEPEDQLAPSYSRSRYIIVKIPKKIGQELKFDLGNDDPIPGWGLRFEESFHVHRLLFAILIFYFPISIAVIIWYLATIGMPAVQKWAEIMGLLAWGGSVLALLLTVWFKWAENV